ncbi:44_t:CDS:2, partial [Paraglomus occultum]
AKRALELLNLPSNTSCYLLDIGCGSGLSEVALEREVEGDLFLQDVGQGLGFRPWSNKYSISALQWLCNADKQSHNPRARLHRFFLTLYSCLRRGARAVFQFYPENDDKCELIMNIAMRYGFDGGMVIDFPNSKKKEDGYYYPYHKCLVPLPNFTRYREPPESLFGFLNVFERLKYLSPFASAVFHGPYHMFGEPAMEAIINFKWRKFARTVDQGNMIKHLVFVFSIMVLALGFLFIAVEIMQMIAYCTSYFSMYNIIDLGSTILPMIYAAGVFSGSSWRRGCVGTSMLFVYVDFILRLRVFTTKFSFPQKFVPLVTIKALNRIAEVTDLVGDSPVTSDFSTQHALVSVFFFVTGNFGSLSDAFGNPTVAFLAIVFSFITAVILLNILIALMSDVVGNAKIVGKHVWLKQKAEVSLNVE